ncbi:hypothetical protein D3877_16045 [Azospirillum cavernae]|uniref:DUF2570 domain-containing protein n=1 Tax=Azospirillum cavernae TaxID=2320860 RepID=A0A418VWX9_9PROT|nr:hypothetical protein [Azospirillum cavernae]RJF81640.1 hypothetical protein D3877_16045 [Azospirillum cavernae]
MTFLLSLLGTRAGAMGAAALAALLAIAVGVQTLRLSWSEADVAAQKALVTQRDAAIATQNAAAEKMRSDALAASQAASQRATAVMKPRPKPNAATVEALNQWLVSP